MLCQAFCRRCPGRCDIHEHISCAARQCRVWHHYNLWWKKSPGVQRSPQSPCAVLHTDALGHHVAPLLNPRQMKVADCVMHGQLLISIKPLQSPKQSLQLFEDGSKSFLSSYWERVFQNPDNWRTGILSPEDCRRHTTDEVAQLCHEMWALDDTCKANLLI